ncbi:hypothetical protein COCMIDRAFT_90224 [Bipolaris oryzae ATCC 44560]|uniref:Alpha/beta hydrolase fold-3 domain-containing protein n=1 Tax=Bipolaris oryzae ATCC 44560 TaxID=930090 RepID=W6ZBJ8_COCMI|nr:uncharacterized protein COCMIDRAFT_90224 [Bipolaris oryzae ATCC 44560]EUC47350.1 hypothetical protein COCMIDRAFT_90224 [Bipolaris oryzae ATCC 44560]
MQQTKAPQVTSGPGYSYAYSLYLHTAAWILRKAVASMTGTGARFDAQIAVPTPGLGEGSVRCSLCLPPEGKLREGSQLPLILVFEGGGFVLGQPSDGEDITRYVSPSSSQLVLNLNLTQLGAVVVSVDYAKSPRYPFPHALIQLHEVLQWALSEGFTEQTKVTINPALVAFMGNSAGGNLAASLSLLTSYTAGPCRKFREGLPSQYRQVAQVLIYASTACNEAYRNRYEAASVDDQAMSLPVWVAELMEAAYLPPFVEKNSVFVAPLLAGQNLLRELQPRLAPASIHLAGMDCLKHEGQQYGRMLKDAGVHVEFHEYPEAIHGFSHYKEGSKDYRKDDVEACWESITSFLAKAFNVGTE